MNFQSCLCVTPWVWICFFWIEGTLYEIATQIYCQDKILELFWQHWKLEIIQISICQEDNLQCTLSVRVHLLRIQLPPVKSSLSKQPSWMNFLLAPLIAHYPGEVSTASAVRNDMNVCIQVYENTLIPYGY